MENKKKITVEPISVYTNSEEKARWKRIAYAEGKMLSKFVRDVVNDYISEKQRKALWRK